MGEQQGALKTHRNQQTELNGVRFAANRAYGRAATTASGRCGGPRRHRHALRDQRAVLSRLRVDTRNLAAEERRDNDALAEWGRYRDELAVHIARGETSANGGTRSGADLVDLLRRVKETDNPMRRVHSRRL